MTVCRQKYRLERFEDAQALYEDLLTTVEEVSMVFVVGLLQLHVNDPCIQDSPEHDDVQMNLAATSAHLEFISSIPSLLGDLSSTGKVPSIETLENNPVAPLIAAHPAYKQRVQPVSSTSAPAAPTAANKSKKANLPANKKTTKLPPSVAALPADQRPAPDPERWLPKRERSGYAEILAAKEREKEKKRLKARKKQEATLTQGAEESSAAANKAQGQAGVRGSQQQSKKNGKKKGKK